MQTLIALSTLLLSIAVFSLALLCRLYYKSLSLSVDNLLYELFNLRSALEILVKELEKSKNSSNGGSKGCDSNIN